jgi:uncharacterized protein YbbK (DUF523 family)
MVRQREKVWIVSACLVGERCRYDGRSADERARERLDVLAGDALVPVCPEVAGGLPTPRTPAHLVGGGGDDVLDGRARVIDDEGRDVTAAFVRGAEIALEAARVHGATHACLKARSPSCGCGRIYREHGLTDGDGVAAAALKRAGLTVLSDEDLLPR